MERSVLDSKSRPLFLSLALISFLLLLLHHPLPATALAQPHFKHPIIKYHNGPLLTGDINLSVLWYGAKAPEAFSAFIQSLKDDSGVTFEPKVSDWWKMVESYHAIANKKPGPPPSINVKVASTVEDRRFSLGHSIEKLNATIPLLVQKATKGKPDGSTVAVIVIGEGVALPCGTADEEPCYEHGVIGKQLYIVIKNQLRNCGWVCAWPFQKRPTLFQNGVNLLVDPPTWDDETHLGIIHFASALASTITNPYGNGFYAEGNGSESITEIGESCSKAFGTGYFPGFTGRVHVDPKRGGTFNAHGVNDTKFLLPGLWNPRDSSNCWTIM